MIYIKIVPFYLLLLCLFSCKSYTPYQIESGKFRHSSSKDRFTEIILNGDNTFTVTESWDGVKRSCSGIWRYTAPDTILVNCFPPRNFLEQVEEEYMNERRRQIKIINKNKIRLFLDRVYYSTPSIILRRKSKKP